MKGNGKPSLLMVGSNLDDDEQDEIDPTISMHANNYSNNTGINYNSTSTNRPLLTSFNNNTNNNTSGNNTDNYRRQAPLGRGLSSSTITTTNTYSNNTAMNNGFTNNNNNYYNSNNSNNGSLSSSNNNNRNSRPTIDLVRSVSDDGDIIKFSLISPNNSSSNNLLTCENDNKVDNIA